MEENVEYVFLFVSKVSFRFHVNSKISFDWIECRLIDMMKIIEAEVLVAALVKVSVEVQVKKTTEVTTMKVIVV